MFMETITDKIRQIKVDPTLRICYHMSVDKRV